MSDSSRLVASKAIAIAAGGGGDVVTASVLTAMLRRRFGTDIIALMSFSWDRLIVDPTPGPRSRSDFDGLIHHGLVAEVTESTRLRGPGWSTLPPLVPHLALPLLLMDPTGGAMDLAAQVRSAAQAFNADALIVVDVGGDILAEGHEAGLRSPLADSLALAAAIQSGLSVQLLIAGVGLDGELTPAELRTLLHRQNSTVVTELDADDVSMVADVWDWHPSEANGIFCIAAQGWRGTVETQRGAIISVTDDATVVYAVDASGVAAHSLAADLLDTMSLEQVEQRVRARRGYSDIDTERHRLSAHWEQSTVDSIDGIDRYAHAASFHGVDALTIRRVLELAGALGAGAGDALRDQLRRERPSNMRPPLYLVRHPHMPVDGVHKTGLF
ncbi:DUF1152 domain-containing protein [Nocardia sp. CNY236]|uniref:DUF1152 domain-containing protein n=1 Tax=Nocardia sp. CNY236 TaxID=1169152 RepID=UPI0018C9A908|nr:DUF1152 domain-containing protein [Nocardia sp. CNY236]